MSLDPLVSVIITCYNQGKYLAEAIESVINQSYSNWECVIINDGSKDNTEEVALSFVGKDPRIRYFSQANQGVAAARNKGLSEISGDFIQFLDADDYLHHGKFSTQVKRLEEELEIDVIFGSSRYFFEDEPESFYPLHFRGGPPCDITFQDRFQVEMLFKHNVCTNCAAMYRKSKLGSLQFKKVIFEDWVFNLECALLGMKFHFDNSFSAQSYIRITSSSQMVQHALQAKEIQKFQGFLLGLVKEYRYPLATKIVLDDTSILPNTWKDYVRMVTPPIVISIGKSIKSKFSN
ncbi:glycosyltransferase family 2 protein [Algoriphagus mannitolivorans]|uniref:glycosyltransferase family 2 protein n=1 Tax=Algoriphagus mannitolivorans TaxID=226504 RepID=UPI0004091EA1|nr:glycosyltransferase family 2 protein [Algoriphagus mannitolivorans]